MPEKLTYNLPTITKGNGSFRILSFNIAHGRAQAFHQLLSTKNAIKKNCTKIGEFLNTTDADMVLLQEVDFKAIWTHQINQKTLLNHLENFPYSCEGNHNQPNQWLNFEYGNSILSKHQILKHQHYPFEKKFMGGKGFQHAHINWMNKNLSVFNVHLHPFSTKKRLYQLELLEKLLLNTPMPFIVGGDFNMMIDNPLLQNFINKLNLTSPHQATPTYRFMIWKKRIDFIFGSTDIQWQQTEVLNTSLSDHFPFYQDFILKV